MKSAPIPEDEAARQEAVDRLGIVNTQPEERFDRITREAADKLDCPISTISIVDRDREWFKSRAGTNQTESPRDISFCGHTITKGKIMVIEDTHGDPDFADNPMVTNPPHIRFYAGVTLHDAKTKQPIGAFCVKDTKPRKLTTDHMATLMSLAEKAEQELNHGRKVETQDPQFTAQAPSDDLLFATRPLSHFAAEVS